MLLLKFGSLYINIIPTYSVYIQRVILNISRIHCYKYVIPSSINRHIEKYYFNFMHCSFQNCHCLLRKIQTLVIEYSLCSKSMAYQTIDILFNFAKTYKNEIYIFRKSFYDVLNYRMTILKTRFMFLVNQLNSFCC